MSYEARKNKLIKEIQDTFQQKFPLESSKIIENIRDTVTMKFVNSKTTIYSSKFLGDFYYPKELPFPINKEGKPLMFLFQINLKELPIRLFKERHGILQVFLNPYDYLEEKGNRNEDVIVLFHKNIIRNKELLKSEFPKFEEEKIYFTIDLTYKSRIDFEISPMPPTYYSLELKNIVGEEMFNFLSKEKEDCYSDYDGDVLMSYGQTILGFPYDTFNEDPRIGFNEEGVLIFQLEDIIEDNEYKLMFGDGNTFQIYIDKKDLNTMNFSKVWFNFTE